MCLFGKWDHAPPPNRSPLGEDQELERRKSSLHHFIILPIFYFPSQDWWCGREGGCHFFLLVKRRGGGGAGLSKNYVWCGGGIFKNFAPCPLPRYQSIPAAPRPPPPPSGYCGAFTRLVSPGGETVANFALPGDRAFANYGATPELLTRTQFPVIQIHYTDTDEVPGFFQWRKCDIQWRYNFILHMWRYDGFHCFFSLSQ